ncbi:hypothetical protein FSLSAGS3026_00433, partial [Streptococcus agalactiae FSL S3-026]
YKIGGANNEKTYKKYHTNSSYWYDTRRLSNE